MVDRNATKAAERAGYSAHTANEQGSRLLANVSIREAVDEQIQAQEKRTLITADEVILELKKIAMVDLGRAYREDGQLLPIHEIPKSVRKAIAGIDVDEIFDGFGQDRQLIGHTKKLKLFDKLKALELLGKHLKLFTDKIQIEDTTPMSDRMQIARERALAAKKGK
jgi:phage terminase small subunit